MTIPEEEDQEETTATMSNTPVPPPFPSPDEIKHKVSWADDVGEREPPHNLGGTTVSTRSDGTTSNSAAATEALSPKFSEEGSSTAAVRDEILVRETTTTVPTTEEVHHKTTLDNIGTEEATICVSGTKDPVAAATTTTKVTSSPTTEKEEEEEPSPTTMGTKVNSDKGESTGCLSFAILQEALGGDDEQQEEQQQQRQQQVVNLKEFTNEDTVAQGVLVSPSIGDNLIDQVCFSRGSNDDETEAVAPVVDLTPTLSDDMMFGGIILPPSMSGISGITSSTGTMMTNSPTTATTNSNNNNSNRNNPSSNTSHQSSPLSLNVSCNNHYSAASQLMSLPIDSLHCVASFLTPSEWAQYGQTCSAASRICREIFRRVRMHGFRCATEVVAAWKLDQHADARELAALYISSGVPIYPFSMGHSYHTVCWRMGIEAKSLQEKAEAAAGNNNNNNNNTNNNRPSDQSTDAGEEDNTYAVDRFFTERHNGSRETSHIMCSYLEDKSMYMTGPTQGNSNPTSPMSGTGGIGGGGRWNSMAALPPLLQREGLDQPPQLRSMGNLSPLSSPGSSPARSMSQSDLRGSKSRTQPKVMVQIHRHLLDQHLLGRSCVDDDGGDMKTPPVSLSADFFHPHLCVHSISTHSRPLTQPNTPSATRAAAAAASATAPTLAAPNENLLEDPAFQAWAARAAATVHNRLGGAPLDDAEELAELQELYSQIFALDRNPPPPAVVGDLENALRDAVATAGGAAGPPALPPPVGGGINPSVSGATSLDDLSTLNPRHGYNSIVNSVDFEVYSASSANAKDKTSDTKRQLRTRFTFYQRRLEVLLSHGDSSGYEECMLDFWDEFFPLTAKIHYYDRHTAVPRISCLQQFLTQPCPKEIGIVQCEIERVKISSKKRKGVSMKGRLFPTYEYRLFIKDRQHGKSTTEGDAPFEEDNGARRDTVLMIAKNRGRKHVDTSGVVSLTPAAKKGANNYYLYTPQQADVDTHYNAINETEKEETGNNNGCSLCTPTAGAAPPVLLGRLQSNFIGTEFQIYTPKLRKSLPKSRLRRCASLGESPCSFEEDAEYDSGGAASDTGGSNGRRKSRFGRLTLRRNSTTNASVSERALSPNSTRSRSTSRSDVTPVRAPRINRRAIANSIEDAPDAEADSCMTQQPFLCEEEDGVITYTANLLGSRPRIMDVCIPKISTDGHVGAVWRNFLENNEEPDDCAPYNRMLNCFKQLQQRLESQNANENGERPNEENDDEQTDDFGLLALQNRPPWWNIELGSFVLNFRGRVSVASVKNFQLCDRNDHDHIMLQFGRIQGRHSFTMDYQYPLTAVQAFSIAISSLQSKISFG